MTTQLGKYRLVRRLGAGGMGEVWEAVDTVLDRTVAVKLLTGAADDNAAVVREAAAAARVLHPNVVALYDAAEADGRGFLVMEYVGGSSAARRVDDLGRLPWPEATRVARDAAAGLAAVHAAGFIHRDVKPGNILIGGDGTAKVADFGLARKTVRSATTTMTGVAGTPEYMSPEQCWSEAADGRTDVYSLGATYYTLLTGRAPFLAATDMAVMYAHCNAEVPDPRTVVPELPAACAAVVRRAMAKQPADRHPTADALRAELVEVLAGEVPTTRELPPPPQLPPRTVERAAPLGRRLNRRALLASVPATAAVAGLFAYLRPEPEVAPHPRPNPPAALPRPLPEEPWAVGAEVQHLAVSPDGRLVAVAFTTTDNLADGIDLRGWDGKSLRGWPKIGRGAEGVEFSADGAFLAAACRGWQRVLVWEVATGRDIGVEGGDDVPGASAVAFTDDGQWLAAGASVAGGAKVLVWHWDGSLWRRTHREYPAVENGIWGFAVEPNGHRLAVVSADGDGGGARASFHLIDIRTGTAVPGVPIGAVRKSVGPTAAFTPDGKALAVSSPGTVTRYAVPRWEALPVDIRLGEAEVRTLAFAPDGMLLAGAEDVSVHLWRTTDGARLTTFGPFPSRVYALAVTPDGRTLLSGGEDGQVRFHDLTPFTR